MGAASAANWAAMYADRIMHEHGLTREQLYVALSRGRLSNRLYVAGGANETGSLRSLEIYDFARHRWSRGPDFPGHDGDDFGLDLGARWDFRHLDGRDVRHLGLRLRPGKEFELVNPQSDPRFPEYWKLYHAIMERRGTSPA